VLYACEGGRDGRVVDGGGLENHCTRKGTGGSNPSPSAIPLRSQGIRASYGAMAPTRDEREPDVDVSPKPRSRRRVYRVLRPRISGPARYQRIALSIGGDMRGDLTSGLLLVFLGGLASVDAAAADLDTPEPAPAAFVNKLTVAGYAFSSGTLGFDANLRHRFATTTAWFGTYHESDGFDESRVGFEYDWRHNWLGLVPSVQAATHGFVGATLYAEVGRPLFAIAGAGRTDLKPYWNLGFDPNDYIQFGGGYRDATGNTMMAYAIRDNRLGTGQTNTHLYFRRYLPDDWRLTVDIVREHGQGDHGLFVKAWSSTVGLDWRRWFGRIAVDPHVNYTADHQVRLAAGFRF
jgi:hypothetical protein